MEEDKAGSFNDFFEANKIKEAAKKANQEKSVATARRKLETVIQKKCQTTMIGALARFEERFGHLWGHGKPVEELTEEEVAYKEAWEVARTEILNNGNNQLRAIKEELARYSVVYEGYQVKLPVKGVHFYRSNEEMK